ncbi:MAG TPA: M91 family zinc metallopeptidase [Bacteroidales bacterium]|nr:M91 family zinc metallopeptidase [Bacteroidales bacterium]
MSMNKPQLIDCIAKKGNISKTEAKKALELAIGAIRESLAKGESTYEQYEYATDKVISTLKNRPEMNLLHELAHAWDNMAGLLADDQMKYKSLYVREWTAIRTENMIRKEMELPLRTHYGVMKNNGGPTYPPLLDLKCNYLYDKYQH